LDGGRGSDRHQERDRFYTVSASKGTKAYIEPWDIPTLRTKPDHLKDDNLDNLRACAFPK